VDADVTRVGGFGSMMLPSGSFSLLEPPAQQQVGMHGYARSFEASAPAAHNPAMPTSYSAGAAPGGYGSMAFAAGMQGLELSDGSSALQQHFEQQQLQQQQQAHASVQFTYQYGGVQQQYAQQESQQLSAQQAGLLSALQQFLHAALHAGNGDGLAALLGSGGSASYGQQALYTACGSGNFAPHAAAAQRQAAAAQHSGGAYSAGAVPSSGPMAGLTITTGSQPVIRIAQGPPGAPVQQQGCDAGGGVHAGRRQPRAVGPASPGGPSPSCGSLGSGGGSAASRQKRKR
jgi:hypothetical protein